jgi:hypothetical protein
MVMLRIVRMSPPPKSNTTSAPLCVAWVLAWAKLVISRSMS